MLHLLPALSDTREKQNLTAKQQCTVPRFPANFWDTLYNTDAVSAHAGDDIDELLSGYDKGGRV